MTVEGFFILGLIVLCGVAVIAVGDVRIRDCKPSRHASYSSSSVNYGGDGLKKPPSPPKVKTVQDCIDELTENQRSIVYLIIGLTAEGNPDAHDLARIKPVYLGFTEDQKAAVKILVTETRKEQRYSNAGKSYP